MEYSVLKKVILVSYLLIFCNTNAYASLPDFTDLVKEVAPAVVKINTVSKPIAKGDQPRLQGADAGDISRATRTTAAASSAVTNHGVWLCNI